MRETTSREFAEWISYLDDVEVQTTKQDYYLAQIASEVFNGGARRRLSLDKFLLSFSREPREERVPSMAEAKAFFGAMLGRKRGA